MPMQQALSGQDDVLSIVVDGSNSTAHRGPVRLNYNYTCTKTTLVWEWQNFPLPLPVFWVPCIKLHNSVAQKSSGQLSILFTVRELSPVPLKEHQEAQKLELNTHNKIRHLTRLCAYAYLRIRPKQRFFMRATCIAQDFAANKGCTIFFLVFGLLKGVLTRNFKAG